MSDRRRQKWQAKMAKMGRCRIHGRPLARKPNGTKASGCALCLVYDRERKREKLGLKRRLKTSFSYKFGM